MATKPGERKLQILQVLAEMLQHPQGEKITTAALAARLEVSEAALYRHFASKSDLYAEVLDCFFTNPEWACRWKGMEEFDEAAEMAPQIIRAYLSNAHFEDVENACPMVAP